MATRRLAVFATALLSIPCAIAIAADAQGLLVLPPASPAENPLLKLQVMPKLSTLGQATEWQLDLNPNWKLRVETSELDEQRARLDHSVLTRSQLSMTTTSLRVDWHPFTNGFRASAGIVNNNNDIDVLAQHQGSVTYMGKTLYARDLGVVTGNAQYERQSSYFGIGWSSNPSATGRSSLRYSLDFGAFQLRDPKVSLDMPGMLGSAANTYAQQDYNAWRSTEEQATEGRLGEVRYFPVFSFGLIYAF